MFFDYGCGQLQGGNLTNRAHARLDFIDFPSGGDFDRFTSLATQILGTPVAVITIDELGRGGKFSHYCQQVMETGKLVCVQETCEEPSVLNDLKIQNTPVIAYLGTPIQGPDDKPLGVLGVIDNAPRKWSQQDVSILIDLAAAVGDQIEICAALKDEMIKQQAVSRFGTIVENSRNEIFTFVPDTYKFTDVNKSALNNLGYTLSEVQKMTPADIKPMFSFLEFEDYTRPLKDGLCAKLEFETIHERKDGSTYPVSIRLEHHDIGHEAVFIAFCEDLTAQNAIKQSLLEKTQDFAALFNNAPNPMSISDIDTTILMANPAYADLLGCGVEELTGKRFVDLVPVHYRKEIFEKLSATTPANPFSTMFQKEELNGQTKILHWTNIQHFVDGKPTKLFSIGNDVTELHEAKVNAEKSAAEAQKAFEIRKVFLANMSHEVRTPLNAIMGLFQLIQMSDVPDRQKKQAQVGLEASHHLLAQLVNVLEMSRVEANAVVINPKAVTIRLLADQWHETALATNHRLGKSIDVQLEVGESVLSSYIIDAQRVTQIVNNLTDNALKFTEDGCVTIELKQAFSVEHAQRGQLEISVSDTGCGIPASQRDDIFERFTQVDGAETRENGGSGLGLAISRELAELMGASLEAVLPDSDSLYTTTFNLCLQSA